MRRALLAALLALCALGGWASASHASVNQLSMVMDDNRLLYRGDAVGHATIAELSGLGVDAVRLSVHWRAIAPDHDAAAPPADFTDPSDPDQYPAAAFHALDRVVRDARAAGMQVLFNVTGGAPIWATGTLDGHHVSLQYKPDPKQFTAFMRMLGRRYSGTWPDPEHPGQTIPRVTLWSLWNEPNQGALLQPQWEDGKPYSPRLYRRLARGGLLGLWRSGHGRDRILLGETAPIGVDQEGPKTNMRPGLFLRELFCLDSQLHARHGSAAASRGCDYTRRGPLLVAGYAHHPYSITSPPDTTTADTDDITLGDRDRLVRILNAAARADRVPANLPLWWTEYGYQTNPPDPIRGVTLDEQARWLGEAEVQTYEDPRVACMTQFLLRDDLPRTDAQPGSARYWGTYQSGLEFADGTHKPAYDAYRLPFYAPPAISAGTPMTVWGRVRPLRGGEDADVQLQFAPDGAGWSDVGDPIPADQPGGVFEAAVTTATSGRWRFEWSPGTGSSASRTASGAPQSYASAPVSVEVAGAEPTRGFAVGSGHMNESGLSRSEIVALIGGVLLAIGLFLTWYKIDRNNSINGHPGPATFTGWQVHTIARWFLLLGAIAPLILAWIIYRGHALSWPRGEVTAVAAIAALGLIVYMTLINKPGDTSSLTHLRLGVLVSLVGAALMLAGSATRASSVERPRKPPGTI